MARYLPKIGAEQAEQLEQAWKQEHPPWARQRLLVMRLVAQHELNAQQIAEVAGVARTTVFRYIDIFVEGGLEGLLKRQHRGGKAPTVTAPLQEELQEGLRQGRWKRAKEVQIWLAGKGRQLALPTIYYWLGKAGGVLKVPRKTHVKKDAAAAQAFKDNLAQKLHELSAHPQDTCLWVADEHRYGLLPVIRRCWSLRGVRVHAPYATSYKWGYLYEALEVDGQHRCEFLYVPSVSKDISKLFLQQIAESDPHKTHIVIWDGAGFHPKDGEEGLPPNVRLLPLPPYSPELNPVEHLGDQIKDRVCNRVYDTIDALQESITEELAHWMGKPANVARIIHNYLTDQANAIAPA